MDDPPFVRTAEALRARGESALLVECIVSLPQSEGGGKQENTSRWESGML